MYHQVGGMRVINASIIMNPFDLVVGKGKASVSFSVEGLRAAIAGLRNWTMEHGARKHARNMMTVRP